MSYFPKNKQRYFLKIKCNFTIENERMVVSECEHFDILFHSVDLCVNVENLERKVNAEEIN